MSTVPTPLIATEVADYLREHPEFFATHADVFVGMQVPHPHGDRAISLGERQVLSLRERQRGLETRLTDLTEHATDNQRIIDGVRDWTLPLLAETDAQALPARVTDGLRDVFALDGVALRLWDCGQGSAPWQAPMALNVRDEASTQKAPTCGTDTSHAACAWLAQTPASAARIPVRAPDGTVFGLLVLGSADPARFASDMGTAFLEHIGAVAGAALSRLRTPA